MNVVKSELYNDNYWRNQNEQRIKTMSVLWA